MQTWRTELAHKHISLKWKATLQNYRGDGDKDHRYNVEISLDKKELLQVD